MSLPTPYHSADGVTLHCGDCRDILPKLPEKFAALLLTDPPYAVSLAGVEHIKSPGKGTRRLDFFAGDAHWPATVAMWREALALALPRLDDAASVYAWVGHRQFGPTVADLEAAGWSTRFLVWAKAAPPPPAPGSGWPSGAELCIYAYSATASVDPPTPGRWAT